MRRSLSVFMLGFAVACGESSDDGIGGGEDESSGGSSGDMSESGDESTGGPTESVIPGRDCPPDSGLSADNFGMPFMLTWCSGCHSSKLRGSERSDAPPGIDFNTLSGTRLHLQRIYLRSADHNLTMPPAGGPPDDERARLGDWLACGAPG